ncbi:MAG: hypothetical protein V1845_01975 [bacterium]
MIKKSVPFYSQKWDVSEWQKLGFDNYQNAEYWEKSSCGILCLKMAIDFFLMKKGEEMSQSVADYIKVGLELNAYTDSEGWNHNGLVKIANRFGFKGSAKNVKIKGLQNMLKSNALPIISIKWAFKNNKSLKERIIFWRKVGGHLALVTGFEEDEGHALKGFYVHHTSILLEYNWQHKFIQLEQFKGAFTGRCVEVRS